DLATDPAERCPASGVAGVNLCSPPTGLFDLSASGSAGRLRPVAAQVRSVNLLTLLTQRHDSVTVAYREANLTLRNN
ncbi:hypothetical protein AB0D42_40325, partial [Streptomyces sp. NPDC048304]|uniref:hypothetical protein n=1 Tax=Streptomyces sp. NPDC048304 TaxID=3154820 RepID=UPI0033F6C801